MRVEADEGREAAENPTSSEVVYRYPMPWWYWLTLVPVGMWVVVVLCSAHSMLTVLAKYGVDLAPSPQMLFVFGLWSACMIAAPVWALVRRLAMQNNAWVRLDDAGITVSDWRRRTASLRWEDVRAMHWRFGKATAPGSTIHVQGADRTLHIVVEDLRGRMGPLVEEIAARAGLRCVYENRWDFGARYEA